MGHGVRCGGVERIKILKDLFAKNSKHGISIKKHHV